MKPDTQQGATTLATIRRLRDELNWAQGRIDDYANATAPGAAEPKDDEQSVSELLENMDRAINGVLDEIAYAGLTFKYGLLNIDMTCDALGSRLGEFWRNSHVDLRFRARHSPNVSASDKQMLGYSQMFIDALREKTRARGDTTPQEEPRPPGSRRHIVEISGSDDVVNKMLCLFFMRSDGVPAPLRGHGLFDDVAYILAHVKSDTQHTAAYSTTKATVTFDSDLRDHELKPWFDLVHSVGVIFGASLVTTGLDE